jgi:hypothetical protein
VSFFILHPSSFILFVMVQLCSRCQRGNPDVAFYCYFDGIPLRKGVVAPTAAVAAGAELVFPSGRRSRNFDELVEGCRSDWDEARQLLQKGEVAKFLQRLGRADLVRAAQEAMAHPDADIALYNFLSELPGPGANASGAAQGPHLELEPRRVSLKKIAVGERPELPLAISNKGPGVLQGKIKVSEGQEWLRLADGDGKQSSIKTERQQQIALRIDTRVLVGGQTYTGRLTVITNGGIAEIPVRLDLAAVPFPQAPYKGANTPRGLAQRMLTNPKPAVKLLESGEVARWFAVNGWNYPVPGEPARGVAAVQQFFECLGLSKPPPLQLSPSDIRLRCQAPEVAGGQVTLRTSSRKWVYAQVEGDAPWLRVTTPSVSGPRQTQIGFEVDSANLAANQIHEANLVLQANGNKKLLVHVQVEVKRPLPSKADLWLRPLVVGTVFALLLRWLLAVPADFYARLLAAGGTGTLDFWKNPPAAETGFLRHFVGTTWWLGGLAGLLLLWKKGQSWTDRLCGVVAGCGAGLALGSILGCLLILLDSLPRGFAAVLAEMFGRDLSGWLSTPLWLGAAGLGWALLGAAAGLGLALLGTPGREVNHFLARPLGGLCRLCGFHKLAGWLTSF